MGYIVITREPKLCPISCANVIEIIESTMRSPKFCAVVKAVLRELNLLPVVAVLAHIPAPDEVPT